MAARTAHLLRSSKSMGTKVMVRRKNTSSRIDWMFSRAFCSRKGMRKTSTLRLAE